MLRSYKFPITFNPLLLQNDLKRVMQVEWMKHFNPVNYEGVWTGIALRSAAGVATNIIPFSGEGVEYQNTPLLAECPYFQQVIDTFHCPLRTIRLLQLEAGSVIKEHVDEGLEYEQGEIRVHIPIVTDPEVYFYLDGERIVMSAGECWYTNVKLPHRVENRSVMNRIHLVMDCDVNDWVRSYLDVAVHQSYDLANPVHQQNHRYFAVLVSPTHIPAITLIEQLNRYAHEQEGNTPQFAVRDQQYLLVWKGIDFSWTITLSPNPPGYVTAQLQAMAKRLNGDFEVGSCLLVETMPDPEGKYHGLYDKLIEGLKAAISNATVYHVHSGEFE